MVEEMSSASGDNSEEGRDPDENQAAQHNGMCRRGFGTICLKGLAGITLVGSLGNIVFAADSVPCRQQIPWGDPQNGGVYYAADSTCPPQVVGGYYSTMDDDCGLPAAGGDPAEMYHNDSSCNLLYGSYVVGGFYDQDDACRKLGVVGSNDLHDKDDDCNNVIIPGGSYYHEDNDCGYRQSPGDNTIRHSDDDCGRYSAEHGFSEDTACGMKTSQGLKDEDACCGKIHPISHLPEKDWSSDPRFPSDDPRSTS